jgi:hypothetical protein
MMPLAHSCTGQGNGSFPSSPLTLEYAGVSGRTDPPLTPSGQVRPGGVTCAMLLLSAIIGTPAMAGQDDKPQPPTSSAALCVVVEVGGTRSGDLECAAQRVEQAARIARAQADAIRNLSVVRPGSSDVRVGVSSLSGTRLRMGGNLGVSVRPARPAALPVNPMGRQP